MIKSTQFISWAEEQGGEDAPRPTEQTHRGNQSPCADHLQQVNNTSTNSTNQPINQPTNRPINQSTNQPINQSTNQPIDQPVNQPTATRNWLKVKQIIFQDKEIRDDKIKHPPTDSQLFEGSKMWVFLSFLLSSREFREHISQEIESN